MAITNPIPRKTIEDALRLWLESSTGLIWIRSKQSKENPRPAIPYGTYEIRLTGRIGGEDEEQYSQTVDPDEGEEITITMIGARRLTLSCNVFGRSSDPDQDTAAFCDRAISALGMEQFRLPLNDVNLGFIENSEIRDLDQIENTQWTSRSQFDCMFSVVAQAIAKTGYFDTVVITAPDDFWEPNPHEFSASFAEDEEIPVDPQ